MGRMERTMSESGTGKRVGLVGRLLVVVSPQWGGGDYVGRGADVFSGSGIVGEEI